MSCNFMWSFSIHCERFISSYAPRISITWFFYDPESFGQFSQHLNMHDLFSLLQISLSISEWTDSLSCKCIAAAKRAKFFEWYIHKLYVYQWNLPQYTLRLLAAKFRNSHFHVRLFLFKFHIGSFKFERFSLFRLYFFVCLLCFLPPGFITQFIAVIKIYCCFDCIWC